MLKEKRFDLPCGRIFRKTHAVTKNRHQALETDCCQLVEVTFRSSVKIAFENKVGGVRGISVEGHKTAEVKAADLSKRQQIIARRIRTKPGEQSGEVRLLSGGYFSNDGEWILFKA